MAKWDAAWFDQLYKEHHKKLKSAVWHLVKDEALAEDIVHETFLNLLNKASELRGHPEYFWVAFYCCAENREK